MVVRKTAAHLLYRKGFFMYISKNQIVRRIRKAAKNYKEYLVGRTFLFVYGDEYIEVMFTTRAFYI